MFEPKHAKDRTQHRALMLRAPETHFTHRMGEEELRRTFVNRLQRSAISYTGYFLGASRIALAISKIVVHLKWVGLMTSTTYCAIVDKPFGVARLIGPIHLLSDAIAKRIGAKAVGQ